MHDIASKIQSVEDARYFAQRRVPKSIFQLFEAGSGANVSARENMTAFEDLLFRPRAAVWHPRRELETTALGERLSMPVVLAPVGSLGVGHRDGEAGVARAAGRAGTISIVSGASTMAIEDIVATATGPIFYQLYFTRNRADTEPVIERVKRAGVKGLVVTVDTPSPIIPRERPYRERARAPQGIGFRDGLRFAPQALSRPFWLYDYLRDGIREPVVAMTVDSDGNPKSRFKGGIQDLYLQTPTWDDLPWIREQWPGFLVVKGVLRGEDARRAVDGGADAVVVSNHGGNVLDGSIPTLRALPEVVDAVGSETEVLMDSGVRRGVDVLRALSLGARAVLIGRAYMYGFLAAGEPGVRHMLDLFRTEINAGLGFLGARSVNELDPSFVALESFVRSA